ncbi:MAG: hypothetical protein GY868_05085, partial [Deltaproteobacteria bacterium]|nr:hypothetical protein [Deltaproteobacteria bacterium]
MQAFKHYKELIASVPRSSSAEFKNHLKSIQACVSTVTLPKILIESIQKNFGTTVRLMVRSSSNCEDLPAFSGAGLYCSKTNVQPEAVAEAIKAVWSSLWDPEAVRSRETTGIKHSDAMMAVLIQEMITPDVSFFMHTVNPADNDHNTIVTELAPGLGDTLANATSQGTPYRAVYDKRTKKGALRCFANYSYALMPDPAGGLTQTSIDYRRVALSSDQTYSA